MSTQLRDIHFGSHLEGPLEAWKAYYGKSYDAAFIERIYNQRSNKEAFGTLLTQLRLPKNGDVYFVFIITPKLQPMWDHVWKHYDLAKHCVWKTKTKAHNYLYTADGPKLSCFIFNFKEPK